MRLRIIPVASTVALLALLNVGRAGQPRGKPDAASTIEYWNRNSQAYYDVTKTYNVGAGRIRLANDDGKVRQVLTMRVSAAKKYVAAVDGLSTRGVDPDLVALAAEAKSLYLKDAQGFEVNIVTRNLAPENTNPKFMAFRDEVTKLDQRWDELQDVLQRRYEVTLVKHGTGVKKPRAGKTTNPPTR